MTKGVRTTLTEGLRAALVADYRRGLGINRLRAKYGCGQDRVVRILDAAGVPRLRHPHGAAAGRGVPRREVVERSQGLLARPAEEEWGYLAGIFDGEGYLGLATREDYYPLCIVQKRDAGLLEWVQELLGAGRIAQPRSGPNRHIGTFHLEAQCAIYEFCLGILPFLMVKRARVLTALQSYQRKYGWPFPAESLVESAHETYLAQHDVERDGAQCRSAC